jgi:hypothetical protein
MLLYSQTVTQTGTYADFGRSRGVRSRWPQLSSRSRLPPTILPM